MRRLNIWLIVDRINEAIRLARRLSENGNNLREEFGDGALERQMWDTYVRRGWEH